eukprot:6268816-Lingulodinium_polyedra.AAC.1
MQKDDRGRTTASSASSGGSKDLCDSVESDISFLRGATLTRELGGVPITQDSVLAAVQSVNE